MQRIFEREHKIVLRSNSYVVRELSNVWQQNPNETINVKQLPSTPLHTSDGQLRSILKKSTSPTTSIKLNNNNNNSIGQIVSNEETKYNNIEG